MAEPMTIISGSSDFTHQIHAAKHEAATGTTHEKGCIVLAGDDVIGTISDAEVTTGKS